MFLSALSGLGAMKYNSEYLNISKDIVALKNLHIERICFHELSSDSLYTLYTSSNNDKPIN